MFDKICPTKIFDDFFQMKIFLRNYFDENALGGAKHDFFHHYQFSQKFNVNFLEMFQRFGDKDMGTRNSPIFWIIIAFLNKIIPIEIIRILNSLVSLLIGFCLYNCLKIKFKNQNKITLILLTSTVFLLFYVSLLVLICVTSFGLPLVSYSFLILCCSSFFLLTF